MQALQYQVTHLDGVLLTHAHQDHTAGIDDLRALCFRKSQPMPVLLSEETAKEIQIRYAYIFQTGHPYEKSAPKMHLYILEHLNGKMDFEKVVIQYVSYFQGGMKVNGFRFGSLAYLTDVCDYSPTIFEQLKGVKTLIISALRYIKSPLHLSVDEAIDFAKRLEVEKAWLTHLSHDLEHERTNAYLPPFIKCAYDGLEIEFDM
jgi:phosphoribosyl 1,2-cyclic phosphate phosphodiesterase